LHAGPRSIGGGSPGATMNLTARRTGPARRRCRRTVKLARRRRLFKCDSKVLDDPLGHSWSWRLSDSISSASEVSLPTRFSILRTAWRTVVGSRPPNRRPISGSERRVRVLARYIATWRGRTTLAVRRDDKRSPRLTL